MTSLNIQPSPAIRIKLLGKKLKGIQTDQTLICPPQDLKEGTKDYDEFTFIPSILVDIGDGYTQKQRLEMINSLREIKDLHSQLSIEEQKPDFIKEIDAMYSELCRHSRMWHTCRKIRDIQF